MSRSIDEIKAEYGQVAAGLGDCAYRVSVLEEEMRKLRRKLRQLNLEAAQVQNEEFNKKVQEERDAKANSTETVE